MSSIPRRSIPRYRPDPCRGTARRTPAAAAWSSGSIPIGERPTFATPGLEGRRAAIVDAHHDVAVLGKHRVPQLIHPDQRSSTVWPAGSP